MYVYAYACEGICVLMCAYIHFTQVHIHGCTCYMNNEHIHNLNLQIHI
jgi:hypothetical protein